MKSRILFRLTLVFYGLFLLAFADASANSQAAASVDRKIQHIDANARSAHPDQKPTVFTEQQINAYLASSQIQLPAGVESVKLVGQPGVINGTARVDFDRVRAGANSSNPLLSIFSGVHEVVVATHAHGANGQGYVHVDSVSLDGIDVPNFVLRLFVEKYLQPRYPQIGIDSRFNLPDRIDSAIVGEHEMTVRQK